MAVGTGLAAAALLVCGRGVAVYVLIYLTFSRYTVWLKRFWSLTF